VKVQVQYLGLFKERLGRAEETVDLDASAATVHDLIQHLRDQNLCLADLRPSSFKTAIDGSLVGHQTPIAGVTNVVLFPPMVGG
jgi:molybdopterin synthase sulfur carrier subunit